MKRVCVDCGELEEQVDDTAWACTNPSCINVFVWDPDGDSFKEPQGDEEWTGGDHETGVSDLPPDPDHDIVPPHNAECPF